MGDLLKNMYSPRFISECADSLCRIYPAFQKELFAKKIMSNGWESKELKERVYHMSSVLYELLPENFEQTCKIFEQLINDVNKEQEGRYTFPYMFIPDYIEKYGINNYETSIKYIEFVTRFISCEFAVRPFILKYGNKMVNQMVIWSKHKDENVRRLSSEGIRPRLPWAMALTEFKKDPSPILPILENLKSDPSEFVRRSVANNLNDISKDNPQIVLEIVQGWKGLSKETDWIIKHGCRSLLKQGNQNILEHYGLNNKNIGLQGFKIEKSKIPMEGTLSFSFTILNKNKSPKNIRIEYAMYFKRLNGKYSKKVFKISEKEYAPNEKALIVRKHSFKVISTRKYYDGEQQLSIIINGQENKPIPFYLDKKQLI